VKTVKEMSAASGVSIRTLHHYDAIGLLKPTRVTDAGYRLYDDTALERLGSILLLRELQFSLREIADILESPSFDRAAALQQQIELLEMQRRRIDELIDTARKLQKGESNMDFSVFDKSEIEKYKAEARERWGNTDAYRESEERAAKGADFGAAGERLMGVFAEFGNLRGLAPSDPAVREKVAELQRFITENFYTCTNEILRGLGAMYTADERFKANIDRAGGEGTADFVSRAIEEYCK